MDETKPGPDEVRMRGILRRQGVGYDAGPPAAPPRQPDGYEPAPAPDAWWDELYSGEQPAPAKPVPAARRPDWWSKGQQTDAGEPEADEEPDAEPTGPGPFAPQPGYWPRPHIPAAVTTTADRAAAAISPGTRRFLYNASAAGAGWGLGLYHQFAHALADCGSQYSIRGALVLGLGGSALIAHVWDRRTRHWWPGIAWVARIPLATAVLALALWAPAAP